MPQVAVIIPCDHQSKFVAEAVDSIPNQNFHNFEISK